MLSCAKRSAAMLLTLLAAAAVALVTVAPSAVRAQQPAEADGPAPPPVPARDQAAQMLERKKQLLKVLDSEARRKAGNDETRYTALVREGLARIDAQLAAEFDSNRPRARSGMPRSVEAPRFDKLEGKVLASDATPETEQAIKRELARPRVAHGQPVPAQQLNYVVALRGEGVKNCSGVRVGPQAVLTAAHCFCGDGGQTLSGAGAVLFGETVDTATVRRTISGVVLRNGKFCSQPASGTDLALVSFEGEGVGGPALLMNPIPDYVVARPRLMTVVGFGRTEQGTTGRKNWGSVEMDSDLCSGSIGCLPGREFVLRDHSGLVDTCPGDSGGPAFIVAQAPNGGVSWYVAGITSRGFDRRVACGPGGIYELVTPAVIKWLCKYGAGPGINGGGSACGAAVAAGPVAAVGPAFPAKQGRAEQPGVLGPPAQAQSTAGPPPAAGPPAVPGARETTPQIAKGEAGGVLAASAGGLTQCRQSCGGASPWDCVEMCSCRMACEERSGGGSKACATFCATGK